MEINEATLQFIRAHQKEDVRVLALQGRKYPEVDLPVALTQIAGWQMAGEKIPSWQQVDGIYYPRHLSLEQCSSEATARYKRSAIHKENGRKEESLTDLTGGFGIDCAFLAPLFETVSYVERQEELCQLATHNFPLLGLDHIQVRQGDAVSYLQTMSPVNWIFIDPARRDDNGGKTIAISDCEPDVSKLEELLLEKAEHVMIKLSPMLDLSLALQEMQQVCGVHVVAVNNECKELLLILGREQIAQSVLPISCVNIDSRHQDIDSNPYQSFVFTREQEQESICEWASSVESYLYESNAALLKAGAFKCVAQTYQLKKLHPNSHLYTSDLLVPDFPGRTFRISGSCSFNKKEMKLLLGSAKKANLTIRNFPSTVSELRKRLKLSEGGSIYLFATTLADEQKILIRCEKVNAD